MKITKGEFDSLYSSKITKREYDSIIGEIDSRFSEIVLKMKPDLEREGWFDYGNCNYNSENSNGYFDIDDYNKYIDVGGEGANLPQPYEDWGNCFPTRWLWQDFEEEFKKEVEKYKKEKESKKSQGKIKRYELKQRKAEFRTIIESKLTKEELKYVCFK